MGSTILGNVTVNGTSVVVTGSAPNASVQVWCAKPNSNSSLNAAAAAAAASSGGGGGSSSGGGGGGITLAVVNAASSAQAFRVPSIGSATPRVEYILTASSKMYTDGVKAGEHGHADGRGLCGFGAS